MRTRVREIGSGCLGSNGGPEPNGGCAMMSVSNGVFCVFSDFRIASNENKISDGYLERASNRSGSILIIGTCDHAAGSRSLHRMVRPHFLRLEGMTYLRFMSS